MSSTYDECLSYINSCQDKSVFKTTTSRRFKKDLLEYFGTQSGRKIIELGTAHGHTTKLLAKMFDRVITVDNSVDRINDMKKFIEASNAKNILPVCIDLYTPDFLQNFKFETNHGFQYDVAIIDAFHTYDCVIKDTINMHDIGCKTFIYDDYGLFPEIKAGIEFLSKTYDVKSIKYIGMPKGTFYPNTINKLLHDWEGVILELN